MNMEVWMSGLSRHPAKVLYVEIYTVGSNPTASAKISVWCQSGPMEQSAKL